MAGKIPARSILKLPKPAPTITDEQKAKVEKDRKNLNIALKHAHLIQHRKDTEAAILNAITLLLDIPAASKHTTEEALRFIDLIRSFQPSDFESLVEERQADQRCGYVLCANPPRSRSMGARADWKLKKGMADWCSDECAKKGLYVKTQLSEVPAWERVPEQQTEIHLHEDDRLMIDEQSDLRRANRAARVNQWRATVASHEELARERGEKTTSFRPNQVMADVIVEKQTRSSKPPDLEASIGHHNAIEGYQPTGTGMSKKLAEDSDDAEDD